MLGLASLAKLFYLYDLMVIGHIFFALAAFIVLLFVGKLLMARTALTEELRNPIVASVSPAIAMGIMMLCSSLFYFDKKGITVVIWAFAVILQLVLVGYFSYRFMWRNLQIKNIFPSWFVTYVGLGVILVTAPFQSALLLPIFYFITLSAIILVPIILYRVLVTKDIPEPAQPLIMILAAPVSIILMSYMAQVAVLDVQIVVLLFVVSQFMYVFVLYQLITLLRLPFYPSYGAFTFPLVICATAFLLTRTQLGWTGSVSMLIAYVELCIAAVIVVYVTIRYTKFITN